MIVVTTIVSSTYNNICFGKLICLLTVELVFNGQIVNMAMLTNRDEIIILVLRNLYKKRIFRLIFSLISSKLRIFSLKSPYFGTLK